MRLDDASEEEGEGSDERYAFDCGSVVALEEVIGIEGDKSEPAVTIASAAATSFAKGAAIDDRDESGGVGVGVKETAVVVVVSISICTMGSVTTAIGGAAAM